MLACINAAGIKLPSIFIFSKQKPLGQLDAQTGDWPNTAYASSANGWMTAELFHNWFVKSFVPNIGSEKPAFIFDDHSSHVTLLSC